MSTIGTQTITVNAIPRTYTPGWVKKYAADLKRGDTAIKKSPLTNGGSTMRITHNASKGIERHILSIEDAETDLSGTVPVATLEKAQLTITCAEDNPASQERLRQLVLGWMVWLSEAGVLESILADEL